MYEIERAPHPEYPEHEVFTLVSPAGMSASFIPSIGMIGSSVIHDGEELLGGRGGLEQYLAKGATFGIALLAPWANRLGTLSYAVVYPEGGVRRVDIDTNAPNLRFDKAGYPIHGLLTASPDWKVEEAIAEEQYASLRCSLDFGQDRQDFGAFPFDHLIEVTVSLRGTTLTLATSITPRQSDDVPVCFGWHPYFRIPGVDRSEWDLVLPFEESRPLGTDMLPTGARVPVEPFVGKLGDRVFDDLFGGVTNGTTATITAGGRTIAVRFDKGYDFAVVWAPEGSGFIAIEPMTAPNDPFSGQDLLEIVQLGETYTSTWSMVVNRIY